MRTRDSRGGPLARALARVNRDVTNPVMRLVAGWLPPLAIVRHRGRRTGRDFATPVLAFSTGDGLVVGVLYGTRSDWVRNLLASGRAQVKRRGVVRDYELPALICRDEGLPLVPGVFRGPFRALRVQDLVLLTACPPKTGD